MVNCFSIVVGKIINELLFEQTVVLVKLIATLRFEVNLVMWSWIMLSALVERMKSLISANNFAFDLLFSKYTMSLSSIVSQKSYLTTTENI